MATFKIYYENIKTGEIFGNLRTAAASVNMPFMTFVQRLKSCRVPFVKLTEEQLITRARLKYNKVA